MKKIITAITTIIFILSTADTSLKAEVTDRAWPQNYAEAHLCLWKNDAIGAISYTIDDNTAIEHNWWIEISDKYDFKCTWFVITGRVTDGPIGTGGWWGTWEDWRRLYNLGHDVQSHTVTHRVDEANIDYEYGESKRTLQDLIPGNKVLTIAYPSPGTYLTDPEIAKKYYAGGRHVTGLINQADDINYMSTHSISSFNYDPGFWASITNILVYNPARTRDYRGWQCMHFHGIEEKKDNLIEGFEYVKAHRDDLWVGLFREVILYGQERDTAQLSVIRTDLNEIEIQLSDQQDDQIFDFPLTVKVRLDDSWNNVYASQNGNDAVVKLITYQNNKYALVDVVPDKGRVIIKKEANPVTYGDINMDNEVTAYDASLTAHIAVELDRPDIRRRETAEVSGDALVTAYDAALIAQHAVGIITRFPRDQ